MKKKPDIKKAFRLIVSENVRKGEALRESGYSESTSLRPKQVTETKAWQELANKELPDDKLLIKHNQLLEDEKSEVQIKALDMAYKVKGNYAPDKLETKSVSLNFDVKIDSKKAKLIEKFEKELYGNL